MCENYTVEEYREVLMAIYNMDAEERKNVFGVSALVGDYVKDFPVSELIEKYRTYINMPKTGEYWKSKENGNIVVVRYLDGNNVVRYYYCDNGSSDCVSVDYFTETFTKIEHKSQYLEAFLSEMESVRVNDRNKNKVIH